MLRVLSLLAAVTVWADSRCASCHQSIVESYARTGKAKSVGRPRAEVQPQRQWFHEFFGQRVGVIWQNGKMTHFAERKGGIESYEIDWAIGSGKEAKTYIIKIGDSFFQSPLGWWANRMFWEMAPGYVIDSSPSFYRPVDQSCLQCHAGRAAPIAGTQNRYADPPIPEPTIGCDRCHGDPAQHMANATKENIVNPAKLPADKRDAVCDACHLSGQARVTNPGKRIEDYRPGMAMEEVFSIYVSRRNGDDTILRTYTQAEQMADSRCSIASEGKLWCGTCHDSHREPSEKTRVSFYRDKCMGCHKGEPFESHRRRTGNDCAGCHMPKQRPFDGSHFARTDHWIRTKKSEEKFLDRGEKLRAWREPPADLRTRNLALAYLGNAEHSRSLRRLREGLAVLNETVKQGHTDGDVAYAVGMQYLRQKSADLAVAWLQRAVEASPGNTIRRLQLAAALANNARTEEAKREAMQVIKLEPLLEQGYTVLGQIEPPKAGYWKEQYRKVAPKRLP